MSTSGTDPEKKCSAEEAVELAKRAYVLKKNERY